MRQFIVPVTSSSMGGYPYYHYTLYPNLTVSVTARTEEEAMLMVIDNGFELNVKSLDNEIEKLLLSIKI